MLGRLDFVRLLGVGILLALAAAPVAAVEAGDEYEEVTFRVTLEGQVNPEHTFAVRQACAEEICVTEDLVIRCTPPNDFGLPPCSANTYEYTVYIRAGLTMEYALLRWTTPSNQDVPEEHLAGSWVVREGQQTISLGYTYPDDSAMPDTALPGGGSPPARIASGAAVLVAAAAALACAFAVALRRLRRS